MSEANALPTEPPPLPTVNQDLRQHGSLEDPNRYIQRPRTSNFGSCRLASNQRKNLKVGFMRLEAKNTTTPTSARFEPGSLRTEDLSSVD